MNRTVLVIARCVIAILLLVGIFGLVVLLLFKNPTLAESTKGIVEGGVAQLVILLGFVVHAIFSPGAQIPDSDAGADLIAKATAFRTLYPNSPGPTAPKA